jgi:gamma-glutamyl-gamma-aminobutyrate hydrolase PuuD
VSIYCGISMSMQPGAADSHVSSGGYSGARDFLFTSYGIFFEKLDCRTICIPNESDGLESYFDELPIEHLVLTGGNDLSADVIGEESGAIRDPAPIRDNTEKKLLALAIERDIPVFGICRATQFINAYFGGSLTLDIDKATGNGAHHVNTTHNITVCDPAARDFFGSGQLEVNSFHHHGIREDQIAAPLRIIATADDGIVEGLYHKDLPIAAIQWHPERADSCFEEDIQFAMAFINRDLYWTRRS